MSSKIYVLDGALLECNQGFVPAKLLVTENRKVKIQGKFKATDMDVQVPATFGQCKLKPTLGGSKKFLYEDSECMCGTGGKVTILEPMQVNTIGSASEKFKEIAMTIPGAMLGNDKAPKVVESYWMDAAGEEKIDESKYDGSASIFVLTENMNAGENITLEIKDKEDNDFDDGQKTLTYSGTIKADGVAMLERVDIKKEWQNK